MTTAHVETLHATSLLKRIVCVFNPKRLKKMLENFPFILIFTEKIKPYVFIQLKKI